MNAQDVMNHVKADLLHLVALVISLCSFLVILGHVMLGHQFPSFSTLQDTTVGSMSFGFLGDTGASVPTYYGPRQTWTLYTWGKAVLKLSRTVFESQLVQCGFSRSRAQTRHVGSMFGEGRNTSLLACHHTSQR